MSVTPYYYPEKAFQVFQTFPSFIEQAEKAFDSGFYLECLVIIHSLMENGTYALLLSLNIPFKAADRMFQCLEYLKLHLTLADIDEKAAAVLQAELIDSGLLTKISEWRVERNIVIHDTVITPYPKTKLEELSREGMKLVQEYFRVLRQIM